MERINLNHKGNKKQFEFCRDFVEKLDNAIEKVDNNVNEAKELLNNGKKLISERIKLIQFAGREGWLAAAEYNSDELADNSDDEKHMLRVVRTAETKLNKRKKLSGYEQSSY